MTHHQGLSRRRMFKAAAAVPLATALAVESASAQSISLPQARVAATILRISQSRSSADGLRVGLRLSLMGPADRAEELVIVVDPVDFNISGDALRRQLVAGTQERVHQLLALRGIEINAADIGVHVFGGPL